MPGKLGVGWRSEIALPIARRADLDFVEIVAENFLGEALPPSLVQLRARGVEIRLHCISLSLGGAKRPDRAKIRAINKLAGACGATMLSEHISFASAGKLHSGHLMPLPRTKESLSVIIENILELKRLIEMPLALENIAGICAWKNDYIAEAEFITQILEQTDSQLLLDIANLYANSLNHGYDPVAFLKRLPLNRLAYVHIAGGMMKDGLYRDTHAHGTPDGVFTLLHHLNSLTDVPAVMLERDDNFPAQIELFDELDRIKAGCPGSKFKPACAEPVSGSTSVDQ